MAMISSFLFAQLINSVACTMVCSVLKWLH